jgi:hypothetical protein
MRSERGQATVEWIGLVLLASLVLASLSHLASAAGGRDLGTKLAQSVTTVPARSAPSTRIRSLRPNAAVPDGDGTVVPHLTPRPLRAGGRAPLRLPELPQSLGRARRGAGALWKRAWFACLAYERTRYALDHPESRFPGYTVPFDDALRMVNSCVSPVDVLSDWPDLDGGR